MNLDRLLSFYSPSNAKTAGGFPKPQSFTLEGSAWSEKNNEGIRIRSSQSSIDSQEVTTLKQNFVIRFEDKPTGITSGWRIVDDEGENFEITGTQEIGRRHWFLLEVEKTDNNFKYGNG